MKNEFDFSECDTNFIEFIRDWVTVNPNDLLHLLGGSDGVKGWEGK